jgi:carbonic anhydrase
MLNYFRNNQKEVKDMAKSAIQLNQEFADAPTLQVEHLIDGKCFTVTRHFVGNKQIGDVMLNNAISRAKREMGI